MGRSFEVEVVTPEGQALRARASYLQAPAWNGYLGVLARHAPLLAALRPGVLTVRHEGEGWERLLAVRGGFLEVADDRAVVLVDEALPADAIDPEAVQRELAALPAELPEPVGQTIAARTAAREQARRERELALDWCEARLLARERFERAAAGRSVTG
ncbi:MAG: hypothetical protein KatS3mg102_1490 [Planctomycetota bacterium]|nr:MAG: hypothetical protein KatS3mg102_1490 [Planctomycetota bacterium]